MIRYFFSPGTLGIIPSHFMRDSWCMMWHWSRISLRSVSFPFLSPFYHCSILIYHCSEEFKLPDQVSHYNILNMKVWGFISMYLAVSKVSMFLFPSFPCIFITALWHILFIICIPMNSHFLKNLYSKFHMLITIGPKLHTDSMWLPVGFIF
jgi:hypothetical protein